MGKKGITRLKDCSSLVLFFILCGKIYHDLDTKTNSPLPSSGGRDADSATVGIRCSACY